MPSSKDRWNCASRKWKRETVSAENSKHTPSRSDRGLPQRSASRLKLSSSKLRAQPSWHCNVSDLSLRSEKGKWKRSICSSRPSGRENALKCMPDLKPNLSRCRRSWSKTS